MFRRGLACDDDARQDDVRGREEHVLRPVVRFRRRDVHVDLLVFGHVRGVGPVRGRRDVEGQTGHLLQDTQIIRTNARITPLGVKPFHRIKVGVDTYPDGMVLVEPRPLLGGKLPKDGCLALDDGVDRVDVPLEEVILHGLEHQKNLGGHKKDAEKEDCQQTHANLVEPPGVTRRNEGKTALFAGTGTAASP